MSPPMEHRVEVNLGSPFAAPILPTGLSLLDNLEAAAREDAVNGEPADNNPSSVAAVDAAGTSSAGQPLTSTPSTLLLTQGGEELVQLGRVERLSELVSLWENFSGAYGAKLKVFEFFLTFDIGFFCCCLTYFCFAVFISRSECLVRSS